MTANAHAIAIGTLRLVAPPGAAADTPALRLRAARELAAADLAPPGLPPAAVLVVRRLVDPLPRRLGGTEPRVRPDPAWERAVRERLADAARTAERVDGRGRLPAGAAAVLFADPAEALACAVRAKLHGGLDGCWWWRAIRRRLEIPAAAGLGVASGGRDPAPFLAVRPREAPAALARLDRWGETPAVAAALSPDGAARVLVALAAAHGLAREMVAPTPPTPAGVVGRGERTGDEATGRGPRDGDRRIPVDRLPADAPPPEPWRAWLPTVPPATAPEVRCLLGVALGLAAAPHRLRSGDAARQGRRWWRSVREGGVPSPESGEPPPTGPRATAWRTEGDEPPSSAGPEPTGTDVADGIGEPAAPDPADGRDRREALSPAKARRPGALRDGAVDLAAGDAAAASARPTAFAPGSTATGPRPADLRTGPEAAGERQRTQPLSRTTEPSGSSAPHAGTGTSEPSKEADRAPSDRPGRPIETAWGGVLYLVHALVALELPDAFERGWRLASDAGPWGTLDLVARGLLGRRFPGAARDPLWGALAALAGWSDGHPARPARELPAYRVPTGWPAKLGDPLDGASSSTYWSAAGGRLRLWSAAGYLLADAPRSTAPPSVQARRELTRVTGRRPEPLRPGRKPAASAPRAEPPPLPDGCPPRFAAWLAAALPAIRRRLLLALVGGGAGLPRALATTPGGRRDPVARALATAGRLHVTSSHVDLVLPMGAADLAVRSAGLDRDPGWLPAFGRVVYFHFE